MQVKIDLDSIKVEKMIMDSLENSDEIETIIQNMFDEENVKDIIKSKVMIHLNSNLFDELVSTHIKNYFDNDFDISNENELMDLISKAIIKSIKQKFDI